MTIRVVIDTDQVSAFGGLHTHAACEVGGAGANIAKSALAGLFALGFDFQRAARLEEKLGDVAVSVGSLCVELEGAALTLRGHVLAAIGAENGNPFTQALGDAFGFFGGVGGGAGHFVARPPIETVRPIPGDTVEERQQRDLSISGDYKLVEGTLGNDVTIERMASGHYQLTIDVNEELAAKLKAATGITAGIGAGTSCTWIVANKEDLDRLLLEIQMMEAGGAIGSWSAGLVKYVLQIPAPYQVDIHEKAFIEGSAATESVSAGAKLELGNDTIFTANGKVQDVFTVDLSGHAGIDTKDLGIKASGDIAVDVHGSIIFDGGQPKTLEIGGSITTKTDLELAGRHYHVGPDQVMKVEISVDVNLQKLPVELRTALEQIQKDPLHAQAAIDQLVKNGVKVHFDVWEGSDSSHSLDVVVAKGSVSQSDMHRVVSFDS